MKTVENAGVWIDRLFALSMALMGICSTILSVCGLMKLVLPVWAMRLVGSVNLAALPVLVYSTVRSWQEKLNMRKAVERKRNKKRKKK